MTSRRELGLGAMAALLASPAMAAMPFIPGMGEWRIREIRVSGSALSRRDLAILKRALARTFAPVLSPGDPAKALLDVRVDALELRPEGDTMRGVGRLIAPGGQRMDEKEIVVSAPAAGGWSRRLGALARRFAEGLKGGLGI